MNNIVNVNLKLLSEKYFSDVLKELLSTRSSYFHPFRTEFAHMFVKRVFNLNKKNFNVDNSSVIREYPLYVKKGKNFTTKNIDLLFLDLDENDDFVIGIENKLFTNDSKYQLVDYNNSLQRIFYSNIKIVYLTLDGRKPKHLKNHINNLVCLSWLDDILCMLLELLYNSNEECDTLIKKWKNTKKYPKDILKYKELKKFIDILIEMKFNNFSKIQCNLQKFIDDLYKIYKKKRNWKITIIDNSNYFIFEHKKNKKTDYKMWIPKNIHPNQAFHMIHNFYMHIWNESTSRKINYRDYKNNLKNCFNINKSYVRETIAKYLEKECNTIEG